jgi:hypothetical protein
MEPMPSLPEQAFLDDLRRHRAELRDSMGALEQALAGPPSRDEARWVSHVHLTLVELDAGFREHIDLTESPDGLYTEVIRTAPRLAGAVGRLTEEHVQLRGQIDDLLARVAAPGADPAAVRELGTALLGRLVRHRQRGSDLVFEAYEFDIGGET